VFRAGIIRRDDERWPTLPDWSLDVRKWDLDDIPGLKDWHNRACPPPTTIR
jgi:hypothetical protein